MNRERFRFFPVAHHESDLLIGVAHKEYRKEMESTALHELNRLRAILLRHIKEDPAFRESLEPIRSSGRVQDMAKDGNIPEEIEVMIRCGEATGTGPMSSVAGLFGEKVGQRLIETFGLHEVVVENGGDLFLQVESELISVIHAGDSPLSDKMAFSISPGTWGVCTSSGTLGHSLSFGKADAVTVISESTPLADAWATALANRVSSADDIEPVLEKVTYIREIAGCAVIVGERIGFRGDFEVKLLT